MFRKKDKIKIQLENLKFLFSIQNDLIKFNWRLMDEYKETKDLDIIETMNLIQESINNLNKAQLASSKQKIEKNIVNISEQIKNKKVKG